MQLPMAVCTSITGSHWSQLQFLCRLIHRQQTAHYSFLCRLIHRQQTAHYSFFFCRLIHRQQTAHYSFPRRLADRQPRSHCPLFSGLLLCSNRWGYYFNLPAVTRRTNQCFLFYFINTQNPPSALSGNKAWAVLLVEDTELEGGFGVWI